MTGRPGHWSEPGEYNILFLGSILVIFSQDSSALGYREFTEEGSMTIRPFAAREGTSVRQWPNVKKCCRHLVPSSDFFVQSYAVPKGCPGNRGRIRGFESLRFQFRNARLFIILFVRTFWRVCSQFWLSVRNSV